MIQRTPGAWEIGMTELNEAPGHETIVVWSQDREQLENGSYQVICAIAPEEKFTNEDQANVNMICAAPEMLKELKRLQGKKPLHIMHPLSTFKSKSYYDKAYKEWMRIQKVIELAEGKQEVEKLSRKPFLPDEFKYKCISALDSSSKTHDAEAVRKFLFQPENHPQREKFEFVGELPRSQKFDTRKTYTERELIKIFYPVELKEKHWGGCNIYPETC